MGKHPRSETTYIYIYFFYEPPDFLRSQKGKARQWRTLAQSDLRSLRADVRSTSAQDGGEETRSAAPTPPGGWLATGCRFLVSDALSGLIPWFKSLSKGVLAQVVKSYLQ